MTPFMSFDYNDAIGREIYLERHRIVQKLIPFLRAKLSFAEAGQVIELLPCDVVDFAIRLRSSVLLAWAVV